MLPNVPSSTPAQGFAGKNILITGGSGLMGRELARYFLEQGAHVIVTHSGRKEFSAKDCLPEGADTARFSAFAMNYEEPSFLAGVTDFLDANPSLEPHVVINAARSAASLKVGEGGVSSGENFLAELNTDVVAPYSLVMHLANRASTRLSVVINLASMYGVVTFNPNLYDNPGPSTPIQYSVAKAAVIHLTKEMAVRLAPRNIRVKCLSCGGVEGRAPEEFKKRYAGFCPDGRMLKPAEVIGPVAFLASDAASGVTGHNLIQDGGWSLW